MLLLPRPCSPFRAHSHVRHGGRSSSAAASRPLRLLWRVESNSGASSTTSSVTSSEQSESTEATSVASRESYEDTGELQVGFWHSWGPSDESLFGPTPLRQKCGKLLDFAQHQAERRRSVKDKPGRAIPCSTRCIQHPMTTSRFLGKAFEKYFYDFSMHDQVSRHAPVPACVGPGGAPWLKRPSVPLMMIAGVPQVHRRQEPVRRPVSWSEEMFLHASTAAGELEEQRARGN